MKPTALLLNLLFLLPALALAQVKITDALYNPDGADTGREWIHIINTGTSTVDLSGYRLFEAGINHKLTVLQGTTTLLAGQEAFIVNGVSDMPGTVFKSSFSLSNTGETISLKDAASHTVDTYSYTAKPAPAPLPKTIATKASARPVAQKASAAVANTPLPLDTSHANTLWATALGLTGLIVVGAGGALYARNPKKADETAPTADEFDIS